MITSVSRIRKTNKAKKSEMVFYWSMFALPLLQFAIFYIGVNFNSILLAFKSYTFDSATNLITTKWVGFTNFQRFFTEFQNPNMWKMVGNSAFVCALSIFLIIPLNLVFSYFIYKKYLGAKFFQVILFLPTILSEMVLVTLYKVFFEKVCTTIFHTSNLMSVSGSSPFEMALIFSLIISLGTTTLVFTNAMSSIPKSLIEAADIDGASPFRQFFSVVIPYIWPTIVSYVILAFVGITTNQVSIYSFYSTKLETMNVAEMNLASWAYFQLMRNSGSQQNYPYASAIGLFLTLFVAPLSMIIQHLLTKYGPSDK